MKLQELSLTDLDALYRMTEKYTEGVAKKVKMYEYSDQVKYRELYRKYSDIVKKYNLMILDECHLLENNLNTDKRDIVFEIYKYADLLDKLQNDITANSDDELNLLAIFKKLYIKLL